MGGRRRAGAPTIIYHYCYSERTGRRKIEFGGPLSKGKKHGAAALHIDGCETRKQGAGEMF